MLTIRKIQVEKLILVYKRSHPDVDIKNLTKDEAKEIYKEVYWDKNKVESLPEDLNIFILICV